MFIDYYDLLGVTSEATSDEIKKVFRREIKKYHDDTNKGHGDTERTRQLIEAQILLLDTEARIKYNVEYLKYKTFINSKLFQTSNSDYTIQDEQLNKWMQNAKQQSKNIFEEIVEEFKESIKSSSKSMMNYLIYILPFLIGYLLIKILLNI